MLTIRLPRLASLFFICLCVLAAANEIKADPIVITSGSFSYVRTPSRQVLFNFTAPDFSIGGSANPFTINLGGSGCVIGPCTGSSLSSQAGGGDVGGGGIYQGNPFQLSIQSGAGLAQVHFVFSAASFVIPPELLNEQLIRVTAPFVLTTHFLPFNESTVLFTGQGTVTMTLERLSFANGFVMNTLDYVIGPAPSGITIEAVPEPASMLLLSLGLAAVAMRLRRR